MAAPNDSGEDDDVCVLIYRESQLRKAEAAAAAAKSKNTSSASSHRRTSTRKRTQVNNQGEQPSTGLKFKGSSKGRKRKSSFKEDRPRKKVTR
eukprot:scaffold37690_cov128-Skeletonema_marinoi.AAC.7